MDHYMKMALMTILWACPLITGFVLIERYSNEPGLAQASPQQWPLAEALPEGSQFHLVMFVHPHCPCTQASLEHLSRIFARCPERLSAQVIFVRPEGLEGIRESALWRTANTLPATRTRIDEGGKLALLFGAQTSGHTLAYDTTNKLVFSGGITASRGHIGDNLGETAIIALLQGKHPQHSQTPVFGCQLLNEQRCCTHAEAVR